MQSYQWLRPDSAIRASYRDGAIGRIIGTPSPLSLRGLLRGAGGEKRAIDPPPPVLRRMDPQNHSGRILFLSVLGGGEKIIPLRDGL